MLRSVLLTTRGHIDLLRVASAAVLSRLLTPSSASPPFSRTPSRPRTPS
ncbi:hypothetical protein ACRAWF_45785 [Streptomyces sp. L7]